MPFIKSYNGAMQILAGIGNGTCKDRCKTIWIRNLKYALKTKTNPLALNKTQRKNSKTLKKYKNRKSPPYSANENCNKTMVGNDGNNYISKPNKNNICSWKKE